ncbi:MAG: helix-turn-helix domain-containing protein [Acidimicrobiales bacterium]
MSSTTELLTAACPTIGVVGSAFYFDSGTLAVGREIGLDGYRFYFLGRGGVLGDVEPAVVGSAFGYFEPGLVGKMWTTARQRTSLSPREVGRRYLEAGHQFARLRFAGVAGLEALCDAAEAVAAAADPTGLALYSAIAAEPRPADLPARALHLVAVLRELRGSAHLMAVVATPGINPLTAHAIRRPDAWTLFGYDEAARPEPADGQRSALADADLLTDQLVLPAFDVLDDAGRAGLLSGLAGMERALAGDR